MNAAADADADDDEDDDEDEDVCWCLQPIECRLNHVDGSTDDLMLNHTFNDLQITWFKAGSALNRMKEISGH